MNTSINDSSRLTSLRVERLFEGKSRVVTVSVIVSIALSWYLFTKSIDFKLWLAINLLSNLIRAGIIFSFNRGKDKNLGSWFYRKHEVILGLSYVLTGITWGMTAMFLSKTDLSQSLLVIMFAFGVLFGGIAGSSTSRVISYCYSI